MGKKQQKVKSEEYSEASKKFKQMLEEVEKIEEAKDVKIEEIKIGDLQISKEELGKRKNS